LDTAFEYISAGILLTLILGVTSVITTNMVSDRTNQIDQTSNFKLADKIIDVLLLSSGSPNNWGRSLDSPNSIGLALENGVKLYQLDRNKVSRLSNTSNGYIPPYEVRDLLCLSPNYFIKLEVFPMYRITVEEINNERFEITIVNQWGVPVSAVNVTGAYTPIQNVNVTEITSLINGDLDGVILRSAYTNVSGKCILDYTGSGSRPNLIVLANQLNIKSAKIWPDPSPDLIEEIEGTMGNSSNFNVEIASRSVEIDGMNYCCKLTLWWN
jgi:hypothetical protein